MDPNACLTDLIEASKKGLHHPYATPEELTYVSALVLDLHDWISKGGFLPYQWTPITETTPQDPAAEDVLEARHEDYGDFRTNITRIAGMWSAYTGHDITPHDVAQMMVMLKISRSKASFKEDNYVDQAGYTEIARALR